MGFPLSNYYISGANSYIYVVETLSESHWLSSDFRVEIIANESDHSQQLSCDEVDQEYEAYQVDQKLPLSRVFV